MYPQFVVVKVHTHDDEGVEIVKTETATLEFTEVDYDEHYEVYYAETRESQATRQERPVRMFEMWIPRQGGVTETRQ